MQHKVSHKGCNNDQGKMNSQASDSCHNNKNSCHTFCWYARRYIYNLSNSWRIVIKEIIVGLVENCSSVPRWCEHKIWSTTRVDFLWRLLADILSALSTSMFCDSGSSWPSKNPTNSSSSILPSPVSWCGKIGGSQSACGGSQYADHKVPVLSIDYRKGADALPIAAFTYLVVREKTMQSCRKLNLLQKLVGWMLTNQTAHEQVRMMHAFNTCPFHAYCMCAAGKIVQFLSDGQADRGWQHEGHQ